MRVESVLKKVRGVLVSVGVGCSVGASMLVLGRPIGLMCGRREMYG